MNDSRSSPQLGSSLADREIFWTRGRCAVLEGKHSNGTGNLNLFVCTEWRYGKPTWNKVVPRKYQCSAKMVVATMSNIPQCCSAIAKDKFWIKKCQTPISKGKQS